MKAKSGIIAAAAMALSGSVGAAEDQPRSPVRAKKKGVGHGTALRKKREAAARKSAFTHDPMDRLKKLATTRLTQGPAPQKEYHMDRLKKLLALFKSDRVSNIPKSEVAEALQMFSESRQVRRARNRRHDKMVRSQNKISYMESYGVGGSAVIS